MEWTMAMKERAAACASAEELHALAAAEGIPMTQEEAHAYFVQLHPPVGELADEELDAVSGGGCNKFADMKVYNPKGLAKNDRVYISEPALANYHTDCKRSSYVNDFIVIGIDKEDPDVTGGYWILIECPLCGDQMSIRAVFLSKR